MINQIILENQINSYKFWETVHLNLDVPNLCCPGSERVKAIQWARPLDVFSAGKYGSFFGTGIGQHSGWTVWEESHARQSKMESGNP